MCIDSNIHRRLPSARSPLLFFAGEYRRDPQDRRDFIRDSTIAKTADAVAEDHLRQYWLVIHQLAMHPSYGTIESELPRDAAHQAIKELAQRSKVDGTRFAYRVKQVPIKVPAAPDTDVSASVTPVEMLVTTINGKLMAVFALTTLGHVGKSNHSRQDLDLWQRSFVLDWSKNITALVSGKEQTADMESRSCYLRNGIPKASAFTGQRAWIAAIHSEKKAAMTGNPDPSSFATTSNFLRSYFAEIGCDTEEHQDFKARGGQRDCVVVDGVRFSYPISYLRKALALYKRSYDRVWRTDEKKEIKKQRSAETKSKHTALQRDETSKKFSKPVLSVVLSG